MIEVYKVDVFTDKPLKGNPATVVLGMFSDEVMQKLAFELNLSETVFVEKRGDKFHLRFFTPIKEIDLCGHATIGAFHVLRLKGLENGIYKATTKAGEIDVKVEDKVWLRVSPKFVGSLDLDELKKVVDVKVVDTAVVDVGIKIGLAEVEDFETLMSLKPTSKLADYCKMLGIVGVYFYTFDSRFDACGRFFAPAYGVDEDPVTGTANSALAYYLNSSGKLVKNRYVFEQGHALGREGVVYVEIGDGVWVGGDAVLVLRGLIEI